MELLVELIAWAGQLLRDLHANCYRDVAAEARAPRSRAREADRSRASGPPAPGECRDARTARPDEELPRYPRSDPSKIYLQGSFEPVSMEERETLPRQCAGHLKMTRR
jgi:hypothetical protein